MKLKLKIVFNAMERGIWGEEERTDNPFQIGEYYDIRLRAHPDYMRVLSCLHFIFLILFYSFI